MQVVQFKYEVVLESLRRMIREGVYTDRLPSIRMLAREFAVDHRTISRAIERLERERLVFTDSTRGTRVQRPGGARPATRIVNIAHPLIAHFGGPENDMMIHALRRRLEIEEYRTTITMQCAKTASDPAYWNALPADGHLFIYGHESEERATQRILTRERIPAVYTSRIFPDDVVYDWVDFDSVAALESVFDRLVRGGHRRIAFVEPAKDSYSHRLRVEMYHRLMARHALDFPPYFLDDRFDGEQGVEELDVLRRRFAARHARRLVACAHPPTAVFLFDLPPEPVLAVFGEAGLRHNRDFVVVLKRTVPGPERAADGFPTLYGYCERLADEAIRRILAVVGDPATPHRGRYVPLEPNFEEIAPAPSGAGRRAVPSP